MEKTDQQIIADYLGGEEAAFQHLIQRYVGAVYNFVYRMARNRQDAEDIVQEVFVKIWKNIKKYKPEQNFRAWLFQIARNTTIDWLRKKKNFVFSDFENEEGENILTDSLVDTSPLPDALLYQAQDKKALEDLFNALSPAYREVLFLHYREYFTFEEIGRILVKPLDTVKSQHRRALIQLRKLLDAPKKENVS